MEQVVEGEGSVGCQHRKQHENQRNHFAGQIPARGRRESRGDLLAQPFRERDSLLGPGDLDVPGRRSRFRFFRGCGDRLRRRRCGFGGRCCGSRAGPCAFLAPHHGALAGGGRSAGGAFIGLYAGDIGKHFGPCRIALGAVLDHHLLDQPREAGGDGVVEVRRVGEVVVQLPLHGEQTLAVAEGRGSRHKMVEHGAQRVDVRAAIEVQFAAHLLGRCVVGCSLDHIRGGIRADQPGEPEIGEFHGAILCDEHVLRFDVAMNQVGLAPRVVERQGDPFRDEQRMAFAEAALPVQKVCDGAPVHVLHDHVYGAFVLAGVVDLNDAGVIKPSGRLCFEVEALARFGVLNEIRRQHLDGDLTIERKLAGEPDGCHAALRDAAEDFISGKLFDTLHASSIQAAFGRPVWAAIWGQSSPPFARVASRTCRPRCRIRPLPPVG
ncbi:MAG: hypothetical protein BWY59_02540 [Verrucomicrobia bacterium ADurb.Bin345]|nr:MAG: hypothetical protein BWY59_02540 [Verrucomicrobia bacterium ADurb.Bin345]